MASAKKKLDEYHLKVLRQLVTLPANKECFDCHQRGPTYVNVTIGSFVCTTCSGMLRGLTPPHRVKSISMATFTPDEIDFVKAKGNDYCRGIWLGLLDAQQPTKDEQQIKDFMIAKYERKRYYLDPSVASTINKSTVNGSLSPPSRPSVPSEQTPTVPPLPNPATNAPQYPSTLAFKPSSTYLTYNKNNNVFTPEPFADFNNLSIPPPCDPFNSSQSAAAPSSTQASFADFDNNPVFSNSSSTGIAGVGEAGTVPGEDRYAALKDLDCLMKSQQQQQQQQQQAAEPVSEWSAGVSNGLTNVWSAPTLFAPSQATSQPKDATSNPFKGENAWNNGVVVGANPFRNSRPFSSEAVWSGVPNGQINGFTPSQSLNFAPPKVLWNNEAINNPFVLGASQQATGLHSSNPFL